MEYRISKGIERHKIKQIEDPGMDSRQGNNFRVIDGDSAYVGPERRLDRRREQGHERVETLLKNFGLDRRLSTDRRRKDSSWFLTSGKVANL